MSPPKVVLVIQARMGSTRLPGKVLKEIQGAPMLQRQIERLASCRQVDRIVTATSSLPSDDPIYELVSSIPNTDVFRGPERDVLARYHGAAGASNADLVVRVTGDNPLVEPALIDRCIQTIAANPTLDYVSTSGFPLGIGAEVLTRSALEQAHDEARTPEEREHVTLFVRRRPERFPCGVVHAEADNSQVRLTVDEPADLHLMEAIYEALYPQDSLFGYEDVLALLEQRPDLRAVNQHIPQARLS